MPASDTPTVMGTAREQTQNNESDGNENEHEAESRQVDGGERRDEPYGLQAEDPP
jgi:hypothetical protein